MGVVISLSLFWVEAGNLSTPSALSGEETDISKPPPPPPVELTISCVGDVMVHKPQIACQYYTSTGAYDYTNNFQYVKPYIESADLALCNVETTFAGQPYTGYPNFSAPEALATALKDAGFDVAITSNNHMVDKGMGGVARTLEILRGEGFTTAGSRLTVTEPAFSLIDVKGVKIGVVAYTYETPSSGGRITINSRPLSSEQAQFINSFSYERFDADKEKIKASINGAKSAGAELIILYFHWGQEYQTKSNQWQKTIARWAVDETPVDMIFASHPHVLQEMAWLTGPGISSSVTSTSIRKVPIFYSMGNFISNQRVETMGQGFSATEIGYIATVKLAYDKEKQAITSINTEALPTWVDKYNSKGRLTYQIVPLDSNTATNGALMVSGHGSRALKAKETAYAILNPAGGK